LGVSSAKKPSENAAGSRREDRKSLKGGKGRWRGAAISEGKLLYVKIKTSGEGS